MKEFFDRRSQTDTRIIINVQNRLDMSKLQSFLPVTETKQMHITYLSLDTADTIYASTAKGFACAGQVAVTLPLASSSVRY